jgi:hypothetical protein
VTVDVNPDGRLIFFAALDREWPFVLQTLLSDVRQNLFLPLFREVSTSERQLLLNAGYDLFYASDNRMFALLGDATSWKRLSRSSAAELEQLRGGLEAWADRFKFRDAWIKDAALFTMSKWLPGSPLEEQVLPGHPPHPPCWCYDHSKFMSRGWPQFSPTFESAFWFGEKFRWSTFEQKMKRQFETQLKSYRTDINSLMPPVGRKNLKRSAEWMVLIMKRTYPTFDKASLSRAICKVAQSLRQDGDPEQRVNRAVLRFARDIDLRLPWRT